MNKVPGINTEQINPEISIKWYNKSFCLAGISANESVSNSTNHILDIDSFVSNNNQTHNSTGQINIVKDWLYIITAWVNWFDAVWWSPLRKAQILVNNMIIAKDNCPSTTNALNNICVLADLKYNDVVQLQVYQDSGGALNVNANSTFLQISMI